jgi:hypothetical protein
MRGVNLDPRHWNKDWGFVQWVAESGAKWVRVVLLPHEDYGRLFDYMHAQELKILGVIARESLMGDTLEGWRWAARHYKSKYGHVLDAIQVGNEPDLKSPSSWTKSAVACSQMCAIFKDAGFNLIVGPGLGSGQPQWLEDFNTETVDVIAFHPYGKWPTNEPVMGDWGYGPVMEHVMLYGSYGLPLWVTEYGCKDYELKKLTPKYISDMTSVLLDNVEEAMIFAWSDKMEKGFGLHDEDDNRKPAFDAWASHNTDKGADVGACKCDGCPCDCADSAC